MDKAAEFYLRNSNLKQDWAIREAKGFSRWWGLYFARTASPTDANLKIHDQYVSKEERRIARKVLEEAEYD